MNKRHIFNPLSLLRAISIATLTLGIISVQVAKAEGLQDQMEQLFDGMVNTTQPGVYESQRRGVVTGGRITAKNKIFDENLVTLSPPSFKAGCGGVDLYGGSLSFVNSDQIVQLLRSVAANAKGYAFQLALDVVCSDCSTHMENMQKKIQALNQYLGNSCQLAQGIINDATSGYNTKSKTDASIKGAVDGIFGDVFDAESESGGKSAPEAIKEANPTEYKKLIGNLVWVQLNSNKVTAWFKYGDSAMLEAIMSLTGSVIVGDLVKDPNSPASSSNKTNPISHLAGNKITLEDLMTGGSIEVYSCDKDKELCMTAGSPDGGTKVVQFIGLRTQLNEILLGNNSNRVGIVNKYANNLELNDEEKAFMAGLPGGAGTFISELTKVSPSSAETFVREVANRLAVHMVYDFASSFYRMTRMTVGNSQNARAPEVLKALTESEKTMRDEFDMAVQQHGSLSGVLAYYRNLMATVKKQKIELANKPEPRKE